MKDYDKLEQRKGDCNLSVFRMKEKDVTSN